MLVRVCGKAALVLAIVLLLASVAPAAPTEPGSSPLIGGNRVPGGADTGLQRVLEGGLIITCNNVTRDSSGVYVEYSISSEDDFIIKVSEIGDLFNDRGNRLRSPGLEGIAIGGELLSEREIIGGISTTIITRYDAPPSYQLAESYARVTITINGENLTFRNISAKRQ